MNEITDEEVRRLDLAAGRAELLEGIMSTPVVDHDEVRIGSRRRMGPWLAVAVTAAAVVLAAVIVPQWLGSAGPGRTLETPYGAPGGQSDGDRAVLIASGWTVDHADEGDSEGEVRYVNSGQELQINWRPAAEHQGYVDDRGDIGSATGLTFLGEDSLMWAYSATDHTTIRPVQGTHFLEVRGSGMDQTAYLALLDQVQQVDQASFDAAMPASIVTSEEAAGTVDEMLDQLPLPQGFDRGSVHVEGANDRYDVIAAVTGAVTCAWVEQWVAGRQSGDEAAVSEAVDSMNSSHDWAVLKEIANEGGWSSSIWDTADQLGRPTIPVKVIRGNACQ